MFKIIYFIILNTSLLFADSLEMSMLWQKLIHTQNNENQIVSNEFYLSSNKNTTLKEELEATK